MYNNTRSSGLKGVSSQRLAFFSLKSGRNRPSFPVSTGAVLLIGFCLGVALTLLAHRLVELPDFDKPTSGRSRWIARCGVTLNLIELPAIALTLGLAMGYESVGMTAIRAWTLFGSVIMPMLAVAAAGEALWIDVGQRKRDQTILDPTQPGDSDARSIQTDESPS